MFAPIISAVGFAVLTFPVTQLLNISTSDFTGIEYIYISILELSFMSIGCLLFIHYASKSDRLSINYYDIIHHSNFTKNHIIWTVGTIIMLLVVNTIFGIMSTIFEFEVSENMLFDIISGDPIYLLYFIPVMILLVGPVEELIFRGIIQSVIRKYSSVYPAIIFTSLFFGLIHIPAAGGLNIEAFGYVVVTFALSILLGWVYEHKKSIYIPMLAHGFYNAILVFIVYYQIVYM